jgi:cytochrome c peroxidase
MTRIALIAALMAVGGVLFAPHTGYAASPLLKSAQGAFAPLPATPIFKESNPANDAKLALGKMLFFEPRLSKSNIFSCNSCHNIATGGVDNNSFSVGHKWATGGRNAPTVLNASLHIAQFWDGRAADVEAQAQGPILAGVEMAATKELAVARIGSMPEYVELFKQAFPDEKKPLVYENIANAIGAFERTLLTPSRFDDFLKGNEAALSADEKRGLATFMEIGCSGCHNGVAVGGGSYQLFGVANAPKNLKDEGRFGVTKDAADKHAFKVPSLRNIGLTYPYFHDGSVWTLPEAVKVMAWTQLGEELTNAQVSDLVAFLNALTGTAPEVTIPVLPPSTASTPRPDIN